MHPCTKCILTNFFYRVWNFYFFYLFKKSSSNFIVFRLFSSSSNFFTPWRYSTLEYDCNFAVNRIIILYPSSPFVLLFQTKQSSGVAVLSHSSVLNTSSIVPSCLICIFSPFTVTSNGNSSLWVYECSIYNTRIWC